MDGSSSGIQVNMMGQGSKVVTYHGRHSDKIDLGVALSEWFRFRVEYYSLDGKNFAKVYVNGELAYTAVYYGSSGGMVAETYVDGSLYTTDIVTNGESIINGVTKVDIRATSTTVGVMYLDDLSLGGSTQKYE